MRGGAILTTYSFLIELTTARVKGEQVGVVEAIVEHCRTAIRRGFMNIRQERKQSSKQSVNNRRKERGDAISATARARTSHSRSEPRHLSSNLTSSKIKKHRVNNL